MKKMGRESSQAIEMALFRWRDALRTGWFPFRGETKSGRVREKKPENEPWSLKRGSRRTDSELDFEGASLLKTSHLFNGFSSVQFCPLTDWGVGGI